MRADPGSSEVDELLDAFEVPRPVLFEALQGVATPSIDPDVSSRLELEDFPDLTPNVEAVLDRAAELRDDTAPDERLHVNHVFGAMLDVPQSTAYRGLELALEHRVAIPEIRDLYFTYLSESNGRSLGEMLRERFRSYDQLLEWNVLAHESGVLAIAFSPDGQELVSAGADGAVRLWDRESGRLDGEIYRQSTAITAVAVSLDGRELACAGEDGVISRLNRPDGSLIDAPAHHGGPVNTLAYSPLGYLASGGRDGKVCLWSPDGTLLRVSASPLGAVRGVAFSFDGRTLVSVGEEEVLEVFDGVTLDKNDTLEGEAGALSAVAFLPNSQFLVTGAEKGAIRLWDLDAEYHHLPTLEANTVLALACAPDGATVATAGTDGRVRLWDLQGFTPGEELIGHYGPVRALAFSPEGRLASGGDDGRLRLQVLPGERGPPRDQVEWLQDTRASVDQLGRSALAGALVKRLKRMSEDRDQDSFLIHIDGAWGSGKSTILDLLEKQLSREDWLVVKFDAWRQSRVGPPWWALLTALRLSVAGRLSTAGRWQLRAAEAVQRARQGGSLYLLGFLVLVGAAIAIFALVQPASKDIGKGLGVISAAAAAITTVLLGVRVSARFLMWESATGARVYEQSHENPTEALASHFAWLATKARGRVIYFVDDVDRCSVEYVVDLLDAIQTLVRDASQRTPGTSARSQPYFVVSADGRWIRRSYEVAYESLAPAVSEPGRPLGHLFVDKIFQLTVQVPAISPARQESYLRDLLVPENRVQDEALEAEIASAAGRIRASRSQQELVGIVSEASPAAHQRLTIAAIDRLSERDVRKTTEHELQKYAGLLERNPRSMKRFVNAYSMALSTVLLEGRRVTPEQLAIWTILRMRWPALADHVQSHAEDLAALSGKHGVGHSASAELAPLFDSAEVRRVATFDRGALTTEAVRELYGGVAA